MSESTLVGMGLRCMIRISVQEHVVGFVGQVGFVNDQLSCCGLDREKRLPFDRAE